MPKPKAASDGGRDGASGSIEHALRGNLQHHEDHRIAIDAEIHATGLVGGPLRHDQGKDLASEEYEQDGAEDTNHEGHLERAMISGTDAVFFPGGVVLGGKGAKRRAESLRGVPCDRLHLPASGKRRHANVPAIRGGRPCHKEIDNSEKGIQQSDR